MESASFRKTRQLFEKQLTRHSLNLAYCSSFRVHGKAKTTRNKSRTTSSSFRKIQQLFKKLTTRNSSKLACCSPFRVGPWKGPGPPELNHTNTTKYHLTVPPNSEVFHTGEQGGDNLSPSASVLIFDRLVMRGSTVLLTAKSLLRC